MNRSVITGISLFDLFQLMLMGKNTRTLEIRSGDLLGVVQFKGGRIRFAKESSGLLGIDALHHILQWSEGWCQELNLTQPLKKNIEDHGHLLIDILRDLEEPSS